MSKKEENRSSQNNQIDPKKKKDKTNKIEKETRNEVHYFRYSITYL